MRRSRCMYRHAGLLCAVRTSRCVRPVCDTIEEESMRILVLGGDGYLGWPTAMHLSQRGHTVVVVDNMARRAWDNELGAESLVPIASLQERVAVWSSVSGKQIGIAIGDLTDY